MTDQRTLKRIITEQRAEIQQLKERLIDRQEVIDLMLYANECLLNTNESFQMQVEAAKTLLQEFSAYYKNMEGGCYPDWLTRLEKVLDSAQNSGKL